MNNISITTTYNEKNLDFQELRQSELLSDIYLKIADQIKGSLTQTYIYDADEIFGRAYTELAPSAAQLDILGSFQVVFNYIEKQIDPLRQKFTITKTVDDEICINRKASSGGKVKIIINEDGIITLSFIPDKELGRSNFLEFYDELVDFEMLSFKFFEF